jgi:hypothetical protein
VGRDRDGKATASERRGRVPDATIIGFMGSPIDETAQREGTFKTFGFEDERFGRSGTTL